MKVRAGIAVAALCLLGGAACKKQEKAGEGTGTAQPGTGTAAAPAADAAAAPDTPAIDAAEPAAAIDAAAAAAAGETLKLVGIGAAEPIELTVPAGTTHEMVEATDETLASAMVKVGDVAIQVDTPEGGFFSLEDEKGMTSRGNKTTVFEREEAEADGFTLVYAQGKEGAPRTYTALVTRPKLKIACAGYELKSRADADKVVDVCRSVRAAAK
ncbi:MAG TPA: hypothetical protein VM734_33750 [Kofleriaceae bacterium]|nr:hypothetical protein [Kofleriaceae bacterium]